MDVSTISHSEARFERVSGDPATATAEDFNAYLDRLLKMIPAEVISLYLVGSGLISERQAGGVDVWAAICLVGLLIIRAYGTADSLRHLPPDWVHVAISGVAFMIWIYSLGGPFEAYDLHVELSGLAARPGLDILRAPVLQGPKN